MPSAVVLYHFLHPDDVVSAQIWTGLCTGLRARGWSVSAFPSNRSCHIGASAFALHDQVEGVDIRRIWRPDLPHSSGLGRILSAGWMITAWSLLAVKTRPDVVLIGTDPILSVLTAPIWRLFSPKTKIVHWCFDLYPEAAVADGLLDSDSIVTRLLTALARRAYRSCDLIADLGPCMRRRLESYRHRAQVVTFPPWALEEPAIPVAPDHKERRALFGDAKLCLLYSGSFGRAHIFEPFLALARDVRHLPIQMTFSIRGSRQASLNSAIRNDDLNVRTVPFATADRLESRLAAADIHLVSLHEDWTGAVVPSKFFGALAVGRPVIFAGSPDSAIAQFIETYKIGWVLGNGSAGLLNDLQALIDEPERLPQLSRLCINVYQEHFSKRRVCDAWDQTLRSLLVGPAEKSTPSPPV
jgi:colanic acid biosynthesis glycosyl transferase WcaI